MKAIATAATLTLLLGACSGITGNIVPERTVSDAAHQTWYGVYRRPTPEPAAGREQIALVDPAGDDHAGHRHDDSDEMEAALAPTYERPVYAPVVELVPLAEAGPDPAPRADDSLAYVKAVYAANRVRINGDSIPAAWREVQSEGTIYHATRPVVGDLVFFHNTYDANGDGRPNDWFTHVAVVESVSANATVTFLSYRGEGVTRGHLNLENPGATEIGGATANTTLRAERAGDPDYAQYLAGELFAGFGSLLGNRNEVIVIDEWSPSGRTRATR